jgi:hypothetical protein
LAPLRLIRRAESALLLADRIAGNRVPRHHEVSAWRSLHTTRPFVPFLFKNQGGHEAVTNTSGHISGNGPTSAQHTVPPFQPDLAMSGFKNSVRAGICRYGRHPRVHSPVDNVRFLRLSLRSGRAASGQALPYNEGRAPPNCIFGSIATEPGTQA